MYFHSGNHGEIKNRPSKRLCTAYARFIYLVSLILDMHLQVIKAVNIYDV